MHGKIYSDVDFFLLIEPLLKVNHNLTSSKVSLFRTACVFPVTWYERVCVFPRCSPLLGATQGLRKITLSCEWNCYFSVAINVYLSRDVCVRAHVIYVRNRNRISDKILLLLAISYLS